MSWGSLEWPAPAPRPLGPEKLMGARGRQLGRDPEACRWGGCTPLPHCPLPPGQLHLPVKPPRALVSKWRGLQCRLSTNPPSGPCHPTSLLLGGLGEPAHSPATGQAGGEPLPSADWPTSPAGRSLQRLGRGQGRRGLLERRSGLLTGGLGTCRLPDSGTWTGPACGAQQGLWGGVAVGLTLEQPVPSGGSACFKERSL